MKRGFSWLARPAPCSSDRKNLKKILQEIWWKTKAFHLKWQLYLQNQACSALMSKEKKCRVEFA